MRADGVRFALSNAHVVAEFSGSGLLASITTLNDKIKTKTNISFVEYGTRRSGDKSGAYLFLPGMNTFSSLVIFHIPGERNTN